MTPTAAAQAPQNSRIALKPIARPIIPVIPLHYLKKQQKKSVFTTTTSLQENIHPTTKGSAPRISKPVTFTPSPPSVVGSTNGNGILGNHSKVTEETPTTATSPVSESNSDNQETQFEVGKAQKYSKEQIEVESDKSSTLADESLPPTTEPRSSSFTMAPPFVPGVHTKLYQHENSSNFSSRDADHQSPMHPAHPEFGMRSIYGPPSYARSHSSSPRPSIPGDSQFQYATGGPIHYNTSDTPQHFSNGFSPMGPPPPPGFFHAQDSHIAQRQMLPLTSPAGYSPSITPGMSEQQRFPSYPSSVQNDLEGNGQQFYNQSMAPVASNGTNGHADGMQMSQQPRMPVKGTQNGSQVVVNGSMASQRAMHPQFPPPSMHDHLDGLLDYLLSQFNNPRYADYTLELHYSDSRDHPISIPGHNLLFARSPVLNNLMATTTSQLGVDGLRRFLRLETDDRFVTSEGFRLAISRLYGGQLLDEGGSSMTRSPGNHESHVERFNLALGYAASGHVLHIPPVVDRGIMVATQLVGWETVVKAVDFAIDGGLDSHWTLEPSHNGYSRSTYGRMSNDLLSAAMDFILHNFPASFDLDVTVPDFAHNSRLPVLQVSGIQITRALTSNPRLSSIKFGDLTLSEEGSDTCTPSLVLSKLLIALPFPLLKYILEHPRLGNVEGWAAARLRQKIMLGVIEEREKRRLQVLNSSIPNSKRAENRTHWESVGWKEHVVTHSGSPDQVAVVRDWVDFVPPEN